ncbi:MAG: recombinase RecQ [Maribacter sp.]|nr:MAG: recombinase RecQ [Maribacter sp.]
METKDPKAVLEKYWGFTEYRGSQKKIIEAILDHRDVLALMPTGGGKSLCFQVPAMAMNGICIVISPLIALIQNQVDNLRQRGIKAIALTGGIKHEEVNNLLDNCMYGNYKFLYLSPERLLQEVVQNRIQQMNVNLIAVDEAHCISQWGHDFRPAYLECSKLRALLPEAPMIALTATATTQVAHDITDNLKFIDPLLVKDSFVRKNIAFKVLREEDKKYRLKQLCSKVEKSAIVYVRTRRLAQELAQFLNANNCTTTFFHGGISKQEKEERLHLWLQNKVRIMIATNAFGMGIDKPDVELIVHYQIPDCLENYFQEAGRAGRNGAPAEAVLITNMNDHHQVKKQFLSVLPDTAFLKLVYNKLNNFFQISYGEGNDGTFRLNFNAFCEVYTLNPLLTYNTLRILDQNSVIALFESFSRKTTVRFLASKEQIFTYLEINRKIVPTVQSILRTYGGIFDFDTKINTISISKKVGLPEKEVLKILELLKKDEIIDYQANHNDLEITFLVPREDDTTINIFANKVKERHQIKIDNVENMLAYINNDRVCRNRQLLKYFGENTTQDCEKCDVCIHKHSLDETVIETIPKKIIQLLKEDHLTSRQLISVLAFEERIILKVLQELLEEDEISINSKNEYEIGTT